MATVVEFDFDTKTQRSIALDAARESVDNGKCCWIDLDSASDRESAERLLRELGLPGAVIDEALNVSVTGRHDVYENCLHIAVSAVTLKAGTWSQSQVDLILGEHFIVTLHRGGVEFLEQVKRTYQKDFVKFAKTLSFLLYEVWDHLIDSYRKVLRAIEDEVEKVQARVLGDLDDRIFTEVGALTCDVLSFRKVVLTAREVLHELATRRSPYVSDTTRPFLDNMVGTLERLGTDLTVEREILAESLNLHMGIVGHRTNRLVSRLTVVSLIFLPLTFLCGVYGMNFVHLPELGWRYGYLYFWGAAVVIAGSLLAVARKNRWL